MSNLKELPKDLPETLNVFSLDVTGNLTKRNYTGNFKCQVPNLRIQAKIAKHKAVLNEGLDTQLDIGTRNLHHMIAYLRYTLTDFPQWWSESDFGYDLYDPNVLEAIYDEVLKFEKKWLDTVWGKKSGK